jgi:hypothetical protein
MRRATATSARHCACCKHTQCGPDCDCECDAIAEMLALLDRARRVARMTPRQQFSDMQIAMLLVETVKRAAALEGVRP